MIIGLAGCEGNTLMHAGQEEMSCLMSFVIPGHKYRLRASTVVFVIPEWLSWRSFKTGFMAGTGNTIQRESRRTRPSDTDKLSMFPLGQVSNQTKKYCF